MPVADEVLRRDREESGLTQPQPARQVHVDRAAVSPWVDDRPVPAAFEVGPSDQPVTSDYVDELRAGIAHLVQLDGRHGGAELVPMAARMFQDASVWLAAGKFSPALEADFTATVAELGEVAGWLAFDAMRHGEARRLNSQALHLARLAGDTSMELFVLGNMALLAQETGRSREALRIVELMERFSPSPRVRVMTTLRRARAAAALGDERAVELMHRAKAEVDSSLRTTDPEWAWWVDLRELTVHEAGVLRAIGRPELAVDRYAAALEGIPADYRWASYLGAANLVSALVEVRSWSEAERAATQVASLASEVRSARASKLLRDAAITARCLCAPNSLDDLLAALSR